MHIIGGEVPGRHKKGVLQKANEIEDQVRVARRPTVHQVEKSKNVNETNPDTCQDAITRIGEFSTFYDWPSHPC